MAKQKEPLIPVGDVQMQLTTFSSSWSDHPKSYLRFPPDRHFPTGSSEPPAESLLWFVHGSMYIIATRNYTSRKSAFLIHGLTASFNGGMLA